MSVPSSSSDGRSPFDNVLNFVPQGHEKALKHAFYNAAALAFLLFGVAAAGAVYFVLGPFLRPLLWAVLCGSVLHPFKHKLTGVVRRWLNNLKSTGTPLTVGMLVFPLGIVDQTAESVGGILVYYAKALVSVTLGLLLITILCLITPGWVVNLLFMGKNLTLATLNALLCIFDSLWVWTLVTGYVLVVIFYWTPESSRVLRQLSIPLWATLFLHLVAIIGSFRIPVFIVFSTLMVVGFCKEVKDIHDRQLSDGDEEDVEIPSVTQTAWAVLTGSHESAAMSTTAVSESTKVEEVVPNPVSAPRRLVTPSSRVGSVGSIKDQEVLRSNMYLWSLIWACGVVQFYYHLWLLPLFAFPIWYFIIKRSGQYFGVWSFVHEKFVSLQGAFFQHFEERKDALFPAPVRGLFKLVCGGDEKILNTLDSAIDTFVSLGTIVLLLFCTLFGTIFFAVQIHSESMHMVQVTSNLINQTVVNNPELQALLPEGLGEMVDSMFDNAYVYGREWSANMVKNLIGESDEAKALHIERQVHELCDRLYHAWTSSNSEQETVQSRQIGQSWNNLVDGLTTPGLFDLSKITDFVKENIGTFMSVLEGVWSVLKGNISLVISAVTAALSLVFGGGTALLNFFINFIVFMTALFYLLASSGPQYKVVDMIGKITPAGTGNRFGLAAEEAINGVFAASFKMAFFYGMWTWLIHALFGVKIVYIPSALAAVFGAVPFLGTYWAVLPAVLELWLIQNRPGLAVIMFVCQLLPMSFVDTAIYSEIKGGGHPYLTGLAIAGGIFCLGVEGALIGPILLCCLIVAVNMCGSMMQESPVGDPRSRQGSGRQFFKRTTSIY